MTVDLYMLCDRPLTSVGEWQTAIDKLSFDIQLPTDLDVETARGALTASWRGEPVVFEFWPSDFEDIKETYPDLDFGQTWPNAYVTYTGASFGGFAGAVMAGVALVHCTGGRFFDPQDGRIMKPDEAVRFAHQTIDEVLAMMRSSYQ